MELMILRMAFSVFFWMVHNHIDMDLEDDRGITSSTLQIIEKKDQIGKVAFRGPFQLAWVAYF
jgi:hypothetical protein